MTLPIFTGPVLISLLIYIVRGSLLVHSTNISNCCDAILYFLTSLVFLQNNVGNSFDSS